MILVVFCVCTSAWRTGTAKLSHTYTAPHLGRFVKLRYNEDITLSIAVIIAFQSAVVIAWAASAAAS